VDNGYLFKLSLFFYFANHCKKMDYKDIVTISGKSGLFRVVNQKSNGVVVTSLETGKSEFISLRQHALSYLDNTAVFVKNSDNDSIEIIKVFRVMLQKEGDVPPANPDANDKTIITYFSAIIPDYDEQKVHLSDMKKILKWFSILKQHNLISIEEETSNS
jgi:hypothetical protein